MGLSIKNLETERRIRELSAATGESLTTAVDTAVRERLERLRQSTPVDTAKLKALLAAMDAVAALDSRSGAQLLDDLYDADGLPA